ncbi:MAG: VWA domain-containing protein [Nitrospinae bacterium]|nr:VWA domain-containing protein [Nitrospinota bacterium]
MRVDPRKYLFFLVWAVSISASSPALAQGNREIAIVFDGSSSMAGRMEGKIKLDIAKDALSEIVKDIPAGSRVALRVYGQRFSVDEKEKSCQDSEAIYPMGAVDAESFARKVASIRARGYTPIAFSLTEAVKDFTGEEGWKRFIILVSDGLETCGGDPCQVARDMQAAGAPVVIHGIGFSVDDKAREQLTCIAEATGGKYFDARDAGGLLSSLQTIAKKEREPAPAPPAKPPPPSPAPQKPEYLPPPQKTRFGKEIRGGRYYEDAVPIAPGQYRLDHDLRVDEYDYFKIAVKNGQQLRVQYTTPDEGRPSAGALIHTADRLSVTADATLNTRSKTGAVSMELFDKGKDPLDFYILIGNKYEPQSKNALIDVFLDDHFDGGSQGDAGPKLESALEVKAGEYESNWLSRGDVDTFKMGAEPGQVVHVKAMPAGERSHMELIFYNEDREKLGGFSSKDRGAAVKGNAKVPEGGVYFQIKHGVSSDASTSYRMKVEVMAPK